VNLRIRARIEEEKSKNRCTFITLRRISEARGFISNSGVIATNLMMFSEKEQEKDSVILSLIIYCLHFVGEI
jgi:hypothetical protein